MCRRAESLASQWYNGEGVMVRLLPNIRGVLSRWDDYRRRWNLQWSDLSHF
jgi:hypothetical protein